ncbi:hypothetical protein M430DRAFT_244078 [Amorphotheca resinae ATCC 22711]|jgi:hypothetical protein|uniref:Uncharacterized protein n=1 Tax=Amorphotheca resinae ATCC 22711 TaxID=857342 RepID=A0A2T3B2K7_AMORE|nr:hypothetical protein M430DRAFT_244078 [Amorphotheca resinae ATCC 22711]PSS18805.1 hypothetical protein M430DRAFT_244078 [Amorphotheca resinae ATCC 22711]
MSLGNRTTNNIRIREIVKLEEEDGWKDGWSFWSLDGGWKIPTQPARSLEPGLWSLEFWNLEFGLTKRYPPTLEEEVELVLN